jgi:drug/metabolite transporter (DMT)-like permease
MAHRCPSYLPRCLWWVGFFVFLVGNVLDFIALGLTKVSIVTLVGSGSLVVNTVMARLLLKETVTRLDVAAALLIMLGTLSPHTSGLRLRTSSLRPHAREASDFVHL